MSETQEIIDRIQSIASDSATIAIEQYSSWYLTNAIVWASLGVVLLTTGIVFLSKKILKDEEGLRYTISGFLIGLGVLFIFANITNIIGYEAYAIHQLLIDLRGE